MVPVLLTVLMSCSPGTPGDSATPSDSPLGSLAPVDSQGETGDPEETGETGLDSGRFEGDTIADLAVAIVGASDEQRTAAPVAAVGDLDGDGYQDFALTSGGYSEIAQNQLHVFLGGPGWVGAGSVDTDAAALRIHDSADAEYLARSVAPLGDWDGDGLDDLLIGSAWDDSAAEDAGAAYLLLGSSTLASAGSLLPSQLATQLLGEDAGDGAGLAVSTAGDVDGDGWRDLMVGAPWRDDKRGEVYLLLGPATGALGLASAQGRLEGLNDDSDPRASGSMAGRSLAGGQDVDGDGLDDLLIGCSDSENERPSAYLVHGPASGSQGLYRAAAAHFYGNGPGSSVSDDLLLPGDLNGDGYGDLVLATDWGTGGGCEHVIVATAEVYVLHGPQSGDVLVCSQANAVIHPSDTQLRYSRSLAPAGDRDQDGRQDLAIGAWADPDQGTARGAVYLVHGPFSGHGELEVIAADRFTGAARGDATGGSVAAPGDVDGDGRPDLLVGATGYDGAGNERGAGWLLLSGAGY